MIKYVGFVWLLLINLTSHAYTILSTNEFKKNPNTVDTKLVNTNAKGHFGENNKIYINDRYIEGTEDQLKTQGHEIAHAMDKQQGSFKAGDKDQNTYANNYGDNLSGYTSFISKTFGKGELGTGNATRNQPLSAQTQINNADFAKLDKQKGDDLPVDTIWDIVHVTYDVTKIGYAYITNDPVLLKEGFQDLATDIPALATPYVPAGSTKIVRMLKEAANKTKKDQAIDKAKDVKPSAERIGQVNQNINQRSNQQTFETKINFQHQNSISGKTANTQHRQEFIKHHNFTTKK